MGTEVRLRRFDAAAFAEGDAAVVSCLAVYFLSQWLLRVVLSDVLEMDEAEQMLLTQWRALGYTGQPPLYTWLQIAVFEFFGRSVASLSLLKNALLFVAHAAFYKAARVAFPDCRRTAALALLSWFLIHQIAWESQRDLSHSVLALALAAASLYWLLRGLQFRRDCVWYLGYGCLFGLGALAKYNFLLFALAGHVVLLTLPEGRRLLTNWRILLAVLIAGLICLPHAVWLVEHFAMGSNALDKLEIRTDGGVVRSVTSLLRAISDFLTPLWIAYAASFRIRLRPLGVAALSPARAFVERYAVIVLVLLALVVIGMHIGHVRDRWMLPLLFPVPLAFFSRIDGKGLPRAVGRRFGALTIAVALAIPPVFAVRYLLWPSLVRPTRLHYPFGELAERLRSQGLGADVIVGDTAHVAGNLHYKLPEAVGVTPKVRVPLEQDLWASRAVWVVWDAGKSPQLPATLAAYLQPHVARAALAAAPQYIDLPYQFAPNSRIRFGVMRLTPSPSD